MNEDIAKNVFEGIRREEDLADGGPVNLTDEDVSEAAKKLEGTEKQIAWAAKIKAEKIQRMCRLVPKWAAEDGATEEDAQTILMKAIRLAEEQSDAGWWIDHRGMKIEHLLDRLNEDARRGRGRRFQSPAPEEDLLF